MIDRLLLYKLRCIKCGFEGKLSVTDENKGRDINGFLECPKCGKKYEIREGIPIIIPSYGMLQDERVQVFDKFSERYDSWFSSERGKILFENELRAINSVLERIKYVESLEIGVGTGAFAEKLGIRFGVDPAWHALLQAKKRGIIVVQGVAEKLPFSSNQFDIVFIIVTICYVRSPLLVLEETKRVLKSGGYLVIGFIDRNSCWGKYYLEKKRRGHLFYSPANFYTFNEVKRMLSKIGFKIIRVASTITQKPSEKTIELEEPKTTLDPSASFIVVLGKSE